MPDSIFWSLPGWLSQDRIQAKWWSLDPVIPPQDEPVTVDDVKHQARADGTTRDDVSFAGFLVAARKIVESYTNRSLLPQTWRLSLQGWPLDRIMLPRAPLMEVSSVTWTNISEVTQTLSTSIYDVNLSGDPGSVVKQFGQIWPSDPLSPSRPVQVTFQSGYPRVAGTGTLDSTNQILTDLDSPGLFDVTWTPYQVIVLNGISSVIQSVTSTSLLVLGAPRPDLQGVSSFSWSVNLVPQPLKTAILMLCTHWFGPGRTPVVVGRGVTSAAIDMTVKALMDPYRINVMGMAQTYPTYNLGGLI